MSGSPAPLLCSPAHPDNAGKLARAKVVHATTSLTLLENIPSLLPLTYWPDTFKKYRDTNRLMQMTQCSVFAHYNLHAQFRYIAHETVPYISAGTSYHRRKPHHFPLSICIGTCSRYTGRPSHERYGSRFPRFAVQRVATFFITAA